MLNGCTGLDVHTLLAKAARLQSSALELAHATPSPVSGVADASGTRRGAPHVIEVLSTVAALMEFVCEELTSRGCPASAAEPSAPGPNTELGGSRLTPRGGLAPWQVRRIASHIETHLEAPMPVHTLAEIIDLSPSYFTRAFGVSFGCSPHRYVTERRIQRAQGLLLATGRPLTQIALECGFGDQSHFCRLFHAHVGQSPGAWRRARRTESASDGTVSTLGASRVHSAATPSTRSSVVRA